MKVYFLSEKPSALTLNGVYLGMIDGFERSVELNPDDGVHAEIAPAGCVPLRFVIDEDFLFSPPPRIELYYTDCAVAVYASGFLSEDQTLTVKQELQIGAARFTVYRQGEVYLRYDNGKTHVVPLDDRFEQCEIKEINDGYLLTGKGAFLLLKRDGTVFVRSEGKVVEAGRTLKAEIPFHDMMGHTVLSEWQGGELLSSSIRAKRSPTEATYALALFESANIGLDPSPYLHEKIRGKADSLKEFLGDYRSVVLTDRPERVGLVYERKTRVYDVRYFIVTVEDGKISNIAPEE